MKSFKARSWIFTLNNYTDEEVEHLLSNFQEKSCNYILGKEVAPSTGTPHIQGFVRYRNPISSNSMKSLNARMHFEKAKGNLLSNYKYCSKEGNFITNIKKNSLDKLLKHYEHRKYGRYSDVSEELRLFQIHPCMLEKDDYTNQDDYLMAVRRFDYLERLRNVMIDCDYCIKEMEVDVDFL